MKILEFTSKVEEYASNSELPEDEQRLIEAAKSAAQGAYAPYSRFHVGAALLLEDGTVVSGSNQENVAYPSGICAERTAMFWAGANYPGMSIRKIAIYAWSEEFEVEDPVYPCGSCRQVMSEYEHIGKHDLRIIMSSANGKAHAVNGLTNILPIAFDNDKLKRHL
jgi:cytidine deaminase